MLLIYTRLTCTRETGIIRLMIRSFADKETEKEKTISIMLRLLTIIKWIER